MAKFKVGDVVDCTFDAGEPMTAAEAEEWSFERFRVVIERHNDGLLPSFPDQLPPFVIDPVGVDPLKPYPYPETDEDRLRGQQEQLREYKRGMRDLLHGTDGDGT